jgi:hypothetical protein
LVQPRNPQAIITGAEEALALGSVTKKERETAKNYFTLNASVNSLLQALHL